MKTIKLEIKYTKHGLKKGGRAASGRPPTLFGYTRDVFDFDFDSFPLYVDSFYVIFDYHFYCTLDSLISFNLLFLWFE